MIDLLLRIKANVPDYIASLPAAGLEEGLEDAPVGERQAFLEAATAVQGLTSFDCTVVPEMKIVGGWIVHRMVVSDVQAMVDYLDSVFSNPEIQVLGAWKQNGLKLHEEYVPNPDYDPVTNPDVDQFLIQDIEGETDQFQSAVYHSHLKDPAITQVNTIGGSRRL